MSPILISPPAVEPLSLSEAKAWLRLDSADEDEIVSTLIVSARLVIESLTRRMMVAQVWRLSLDGWPSAPVAIPLSPVRAIPAVRWVESYGGGAELSQQGYRLETQGGQASLRLLVPGPEGAVGVEIDVEAGFGADAAGVPAPLRQAMRLLIARWHENRGDIEADADIARTPAAIAALIAPYRRLRLA